MSFYDEEKSRLLVELSARRQRRSDILEKIASIQDTKLTRDQIARLKLYLDTTLNDEQIIANRLWGKPVDRIQEIERCLIVEK